MIYTPYQGHSSLVATIFLHFEFVIDFTEFAIELYCRFFQNLRDNAESDDPPPRETLANLIFVVFRYVLLQILNTILNRVGKNDFRFQL